MPEFTSRLAFKAYEIEELVDVYFFRPVGIVFAHAARVMRLTPTAVTLASILVGVAGGALLYFETLALAGVALIVWYGVLDSSDGQLARMTGQESELGRVMDGLGGYVVHAAIYLAIVFKSVDRTGSLWIVPVAAAAGLANAIHAQLYDYHRTSYLRVAIKGQLPASATVPGARWAASLLRTYERVQRRLLGLHREVEKVLAARATNGAVRPEDRQRYRRHFYLRVRGWNLLGDNVRRFAIAVLAWLNQLEWFFAFLLVPMNLVLVALWIWQARADRRFLREL